MIGRLSDTARAQFLAACCERALELYAELAPVYDRRVDRVVEATWALAAGRPASVARETARLLAHVATESYELSPAFGHVFDVFAYAAEYLTTQESDLVRLSANNMLSAIDFASDNGPLSLCSEDAWQRQLLESLILGPMKRDEVRARFLASPPGWLAEVRRA